MKSLLAILLLTCGLGAGYWKMQNPDGGVIEAKTQAQGVLNRLAAGFETVKAGGATATDTTNLGNMQGVSEQLAMTQSQIDALGSTMQESQTELNERIGSIEQKLSETTGAATNASSANDSAQLNSLTQALQNSNSASNAKIAKLSDDINKRISSLETAIRSDASNEEAAGNDALKSLDTRLDSLGSLVRKDIDSLSGEVRSSATAAGDRIADIEDKLAAVEGRFETLAASSGDGINPDSGGIEALSIKLDQRIADMEGRVAAATDSDTRAALDDLQEKLREANSEIYLANSKIAELENSLLIEVEQNQLMSSTFSDQLKGIEANAMAEPDSAADKAATTALITEATSELNMSVDTLGTDLGAIKSSITTLNTGISTLRSDLGAINKKVETLQTAAPVANQAAASSPDNTALTNELASVKASLNAMQSELAVLKDGIEPSSIEATQGQLQQQLVELEKRVASGSSAAEINSLTAALEQSRKRINLLETRVTDLPASNEAEGAKAVQQALEKQIAALEKRLAAAPSKPNEQMESTLSEVQQKVSDLEQKGFVTADQLQKLSETNSIQYKIYFDVSSVRITEEAAKVLDSLIAQESTRATAIAIFGTTDRTGPSDFNQQLAVKRANRARSYLIQRGFDFSKINAVDGIGEDLAASKLPDGKEDPNQRSVIIYAFQP